MQWLGIGDWNAYMELPADVVSESIHLMHYEHDERERAERYYESHRRSKSKTPIKPYQPREYVSPLSLPPKKPVEQKTIIDEQGHKRVVREKQDGTVVRHRELTDGDLVMWNIFGVPKSFRGKTNLAEAVKKQRKSDGD